LVERGWRPGDGPAPFLTKRSSRAKTRG
jgi:hypothetical protein